MKTNQVCRYCEGTSFYTATVRADGSSGSLLPVGILRDPTYTNVICGQCGHTEWFVSKEHLPLVREKLDPLV